MSFNKDHRAAAENHLSAAHVFYAQAADAAPTERATALNQASRGVTLSRARSLLALAESVGELVELLKTSTVTHPPEWAGVDATEYGPVVHHGWPIFRDKAEATIHAQTVPAAFVDHVHCLCGCGDVAWVVSSK